MNRKRPTNPFQPLQRFFSRQRIAAGKESSRAPWWLRWALEIIVTIVVLSALAWAADRFWFGAPVAQCALLSIALVPLAFAAPAGVLVIAGAVVAFLVGARSTTLALLIIGSVLAASPELAAALDWNNPCRG